MKQITLIFLIILFSSVYIAGQKPDLTGKGWKLYLQENGNIKQLVFNGSVIRDTIRFYPDGQFAGPSFYIAFHRNDAFKGILLDNNISEWEREGNLNYKGTVDDLQCDMIYKNINGKLVIEITIKNTGHTIYQPLKAGLKMGIDTYMEKYPEWLNKYFPTLLRCEKNHFWGYLMTPKKNILLLTSSDAVASWSIDYNYESSEGENTGKPSYRGGHRINGVNLDLINAPPLPDRHPSHLYQLYPGEEKKWEIYLTGLKNIEDIEEEVSKLNKAPIFDLERTGYNEGEIVHVSVVSEENPQIYLESKLLASKRINENTYVAEFNAEAPGHYKLTACTSGKTTEAIITVHHPWRWYLKKAREEALRIKQKATTHIESWYGFIPAFGAARYMPDPSIDNKHIQNFEFLYDLLHIDNEPRYRQHRIQNTSGTIDILNAKYKAFGDINDIERASNLADWLIEYSQTSDGAYRNFSGNPKSEEGGSLYTSVIYVAKSILDLALTEKELSETDIKWKSNYKRHFESASHAIDHLVSLDGNLTTEGELTFEDGMIACTALQIAYLGLQEEKEKNSDIYRDAALKILDSHDCLTQLKIPDGRQRGGTMRFWESQYDVMMIPNFMNSPHGWSAWRGYATYYVYLLTGDDRWLIETFNAASSFVQLIDYNTGRLRWSFCANPFVPVQMTKEPHPTAKFDSISLYHLNTMHYLGNQFIIGENYIDMVSNWQPFNTQDNDVYEVFKFLEEAVLTNAFVVERESGEFIGYNCTVKKTDDILEIEPNDDLITTIHCNLKSNNRIKAYFNNKTITCFIKKDNPEWIRNLNK